MKKLGKVHFGIFLKSSALTYILIVEQSNRFYYLGPHFYNPWKHKARTNYCKMSCTTNTMFLQTPLVYPAAQYNPAVRLPAAAHVAIPHRTGYHRAWGGVVGDPWGGLWAQDTQQVPVVTCGSLSGSMVGISGAWRRPPAWAHLRLPSPSWQGETESVRRCGSCRVELSAGGVTLTRRTGGTRPLPLGRWSARRSPGCGQPCSWRPPMWPCCWTPRWPMPWFARLPESGTALWPGKPEGRWRRREIIPEPKCWRRPCVWLSNSRADWTWCQRDKIVFAWVLVLPSANTELSNTKFAMAADSSPCPYNCRLSCKAILYPAGGALA